MLNFDERLSTNNPHFGNYGSSQVVRSQNLAAKFVLTVQQNEPNTVISFNKCKAPFIATRLNSTELNSTSS